MKFNPFRKILFFLAVGACWPLLSPAWGQEAPAGAVTEGGVVFGINPDAYGKGDTSKFTVWAFSQTGNSDQDPQVLDLCPDIDPRAWAKWDIWGTKAADYNFNYPAACKDKGICFIAGGTASIFFKDECADEAEFKAQAAWSAQGEPVTTMAGFYRGSLANPAYRQRLIRFGEIQIDGGVDGLFYDEVGGTYEGGHWQGDGGFDDADVADFGHYLCVKHKGLAPEQWKSQFGIEPQDHLDCAGASAQRGRGFDYRGYLKRKGVDVAPLNTAANPLAADWGRTDTNKPDPDEGTFTQDYPALVYWQEIVTALRDYARKKYGKEIFITSNGIWPFVDFQCVGLYDFNHDGPNGREANYVPVVDGHLNGAYSLQQAFQLLKARSLRVARRVVPVSMFLDWPTPNMNRYNALPLQEREDYWRLYEAEAYANGVYFCYHLKTTTGEPTAEQQGMMPFFKSYSAFYRAHADLYHGAKDLDQAVTLSAPHIMENLVQLPDGRRVLHLVNHNYSKGFQKQAGLAVTLPLDQAPRAVTVVSPDAGKDRPVRFTYENGLLKTKLDSLEAYSALVIK